MKVLKHKLFDDRGKQVTFKKSPNASGVIEPEFLVMHYTAGVGMAGSVEWLCDPAADASAHLVIGRSGEIAQLVPFNRKAWHAGASQWDGRDGVNAFSIGIELDNAGLLQGSPGRWRSWKGHPIDDEEVEVHPHPETGEERGWHTYAPKQLEVARKAASVLVKKYKLRDVIGHEDISPGRKTDPGPAFPMASFRGSVMGRKSESLDLYEVTTGLNIRTGPGSEHAKLPASPLPPGTKVRRLWSEGVWWKVDVLELAGADPDLVGWVHGRFLRAVR